MLFQRKSLDLPSADATLPGRAEAIPTAENHFIFDRPLKADLPQHLTSITLGLGCFWGAERKFWQTPGVWLTAVGYAGGMTENPTYQEVCSGLTGHTEVVKVDFDPSVISLEDILKIFWEAHDPTQGMRQGNDIGTQYRSMILTNSPEQTQIAEASKTKYQEALRAAGHTDPITTEIAPLADFYFAEEDHQQYLGKNPNGYCGLGGTGVSCPIGLPPP